MGVSTSLSSIPPGNIKLMKNLYLDARIPFVSSSAAPAWITLPKNMPADVSNWLHS